MLLIVGGITLYRTFAFYEEKKEFNVLKEVIPNFVGNDIELTMKVNGESTKIIPKKGNYSVVITCDNEAVGLWDYDKWNITIDNLTKTRVKCMLDFKSIGILIEYQENTAFWKHRETVTKIVFENKLIPKENAVYTYDVSVEQDKGVMAYLVPEQDDSSKHILYIQGMEKIVANSNSKYLFYCFNNLKSIEGLEYFDTSNVTVMQSMFGGSSNLNSLDLSHFDTKNTTNILYMFQDCHNLKSLDISNFTIPDISNINAVFLGMPSDAKVYVKDKEMQNWVLNTKNRPESWTIENIIIKS